MGTRAFEDTVSIVWDQSAGPVSVAYDKIREFWKKTLKRNKRRKQETLRRPFVNRNSGMHTDMYTDIYTHRHIHTERHPDMATRASQTAVWLGL